MADCKDKHYRELLRICELNLLSDAEYDDLALHLMECQSCFDEAKRFAEISRYLSHSQRTREMVRHVSDRKSEAETKPKPRYSYLSIPTIIAVAAVLILLLIKPWDIDIRTTKEAKAAENRLLIMYFDDLSNGATGDNLGKIVANLLAIDLSESSYLQVVSEQRLSDLLHLLGLENAKAFDSSTVLRIAHECQTRWIVTGKIIQTSPVFVITTQLVEVSTGVITASQKIAGSENKDIFSIVDELSAGIKNKLSLPEQAFREPDIAISKITTGSWDAYLHYTKGLEYRSKLYSTEAIKNFNEAVKFDTTFAMAYYQLSNFYPEYINKAEQYIENADYRGQLYIKAKKALLAGKKESYINIMYDIIRYFPDDKQAYFDISMFYYDKNNYTEAVQSLLKAIELDPLYKEAYNQLIYTYDNLGDYSNAIWASQKYIDIAPDEANPYDTRGDLYAANGNLKEAINSYQIALRNKPDFSLSLFKLANSFLFDGNYEKAQEIYGRLANDSILSNSIGGHIDLVSILLYQGRFDTSLIALDDILHNICDTLIATGKFNILANIYSKKAMVYEEIGYPDKAIVEIESALEFYDHFDDNERVAYREYLAQYLAEAGYKREAYLIADEIHDFLLEADLPMFHHDRVLGMIKFGSGEFGQAIANLEKAACSHKIADNYGLHFMLARAYQETGNLTDAIALYERMISTYSINRMYELIKSVDTHYYLGRAYEDNQQFDKAIGQYENFLNIRIDADKNLILVTDARARLQKLIGRS